MPEECSDVEAIAAKAGDQHYKAMTEWATTGQAEPLRTRARGIAGRYRQALKWVIDCYSNARDSIRARRKLQVATEFKDLVEQDIEMLDSH